MKYLRFVFTGIMIAALFLLNGCGSGNSGSAEVGGTVTLESSQACIGCHAGVSSSVVVTAKIVEEWKSSNHNTSQSGRQFGAGCVDCHEPTPGHPNVCNRCHGGTPSASNVIGTDVVRNPDEEKKCYKCHHAKTLSAGHFNNNTSANAPASYVSKNYSNKCRACHNPHDVTALMALNKDWAASKHGNPNEVAWQYYDFKAQNRTACIRCHTTTGYINFVTGAANAFPTTTWATADDKTKEVLACNACHESYDFKNSVRKLGAFTAPYGGSAASPDGLYPVAYPNSGQSNICIRCHAGRESGGSIDAASDVIGQKGSISAQTAINGTGFKNSHYLGAAEVFYGKAGFHYYTSMKKYDTGFNTGSNFGNWSHGRLGMIDPATGKNFVAVQGTATASTVTDSGKEGPCVACHMGNQGGAFNARSHTFNPFNTALSTAPAGGCYGCHGATGSAPENMEVLADEERALFDRGMDFFNWAVLNNQVGNKAKIYYDSSTNPYFFSDPVLRAAANQFKQWNMGVNNATGIRMEGACFNLNLLSREKGAHVHNRAYARRIIFDSIQYLLTGTNTYSYATGSAATLKVINGSTDINAVLPFSTYSAARPTWKSATGEAVSISALKTWLVRNSGTASTVPATEKSKWYRR